MKVYSAENQLDAQRVADSLDGAGINCRVHGRYLSGAVGELPPGDILSVWIEDAVDYDQARLIIISIERESLLPRGKDVSCPQCGEQLGSQFSHCWQCGAAVSTADNLFGQ